MIRTRLKYIYAIYIWPEKYHEFYEPWRIFRREPFDEACAANHARRCEKRLQYLNRKILPTLSRFRREKNARKKYFTAHMDMPHNMRKHLAHRRKKIPLFIFLFSSPSLSLFCFSTFSAAALFPIDRWGGDLALYHCLFLPTLVLSYRRINSMESRRTRGNNCVKTISCCYPYEIKYEIHRHGVRSVGKKKTP